MQTASTNTFVKKLCNKSIREISLLLNIPWSTVSGIITKWMNWEQQQLSRKVVGHVKMPERGQRMLKCTVRRSRQLFAESVTKDRKLCLAFRLAQQQCIKSFME
ncbi:unnamed protein product [Staurois parvus]|uniref:Transposase n=1 Tax=Staurois parvus TaxID=386267 RepID=A0ABN9C041_9NEOB|nr:unnamed protein product [Staurois parvus]